MTPMRPFLSVASNLHTTEQLAALKEAGADQVFFAATTLFGSGRANPPRCGEYAKRTVASSPAEDSTLPKLLDDYLEYLKARLAEEQ